MVKLGILGSTRGSNMLSIIQAIKQHVLSASIEVVISNKEDALILAKARDYGLPARFLSSKGVGREEYDRQLTDLLVQYNVDLIVLIGYMRILSADFVSFWDNKVINVHPSLLPAFAGKMDMAVHQAVIDAGVEETGCTIHFVTQEVDAGPILLQKKCAVDSGDNAESLKARVQSLEGPALVEAIQHFNK